MPEISLHLICFVWVSVGTFRGEEGPSVLVGNNIKTQVSTCNRKICVPWNAGLARILLQTPMQETD